MDRGAWFPCPVRGRVSGAGGSSWKEHNIPTTEKKTKDASKVTTLSEEQFHAIARALADPRRFAIFQQIAGGCDGVACVALGEHGKISPATISHHVKELSEAGLIEVRREGRNAHLLLCRPVFDTYVKRLASL
jgi:ArsR family transcriptional regulator